MIDTDSIADALAPAFLFVVFAVIAVIFGAAVIGLSLAIGAVVQGV